MRRDPGDDILSPLPWSQVPSQVEVVGVEVIQWCNSPGLTLGVSTAFIDFLIFLPYIHVS